LSIISELFATVRLLKSIFKTQWLIYCRTLSDLKHFNGNAVA